MVFVLDKHKKPLGFTTEKRARQLMDARRACIYRYFPFVIIVKDVDVREITDIPTYRIKIDPGAKYTGFAILEIGTNRVMYYIELKHRAGFVKDAMDTRRQCRRNRRSRETWYRRCKYKDGGKFESARPKGWLPPSQKSIVDNVIAMVKKLCKIANITECSFEAVRIDTQLLDNPDIEGVEYQHGELYGYELREYLLEKYQHICQYCNGASGDSVLEWEHKQPKSRGGSDKLSNATLSCHKCNQEKNNLTPKEWMESIQSKAHKTKLDEARVKGISDVMSGKASASNRYCAWANSTRRAEEKALFAIFGNVECSSGGRTKFNRTRLGLPKQHFIDALCVGEVPQDGFVDKTNKYYLTVEAMGRGTRFRGKINKCGIIIKKLGKSPKSVKGFMNGDIVAVDKPEGMKYKGHHIGRVMTRASGYFDIRTTKGELINANSKFCKVLQHNSGYQFAVKRMDA